MSLILSIDTTTAVSSAAISKNGQTIAYSENHIDRSHAAKLNSLIETTCAKSGIELNEIQAVAISKGPGSYTGLRIGVSGAKGLAYALQIPLIAIDTLKIMAKMAVSKIENQLTESSIIIPMIEARRDEVYSAIFDKNLNLIRNTEAEILNKTSFNEYSSKQIFICGDGSEKAVNIIDNKEIIQIENIYPSAKFMSWEANIKFNKQDIEDIAYFEPYYLKEFIATTPKNKVLGKLLQPKNQ